MINEMQTEAVVATLNYNSICLGRLSTTTKIYSNNLPPDLRLETETQ